MVIPVNWLLSIIHAPRSVQEGGAIMAGQEPVIKQGIIPSHGSAA